MWKVGDRIGGGWHGGHDGEFVLCCRATESEHLGLTHSPFMRQVPARHVKKDCSKCATTESSTAKRGVADVCFPCSSLHSLHNSSIVLTFQQMPSTVSYAPKL